MFVCKAVYWFLLAVACVAQEYVIDDSVGRGRRFDGVGAISGGGVRVPDVNSVKLRSGQRADWSVPPPIKPRCCLCIHIPHYPHPNPDPNPTPIPNPNPKSYPNLKLFNQ